MTEEFHSPVEPEPVPFWVNRPSIFTKEYLEYLWDTHRVAATLPGGLFRSGNYELAKDFPRFRKGDLFDDVPATEFKLESEAGS